MRQPLRQTQPDGPDEVGLTRQRLDGVRERAGGKLRDVRRVARQDVAMQGRRAAVGPGRIGDRRQIDEADRPAEALERPEIDVDEGPLPAANEIDGPHGRERPQRVEHTLIPPDVRRKRHARRDEKNAGRHDAGGRGMPLIRSKERRPAPGASGLSGGRRAPAPGR